MNSFITWIGGKKLLRKKILEQFPEEGTYNRYVEVFGGAAWVLFSKEKHADFEVYNDVNGNLVNLFRCVKYHPETVQKELDWLLMSWEQFFDAREQLNVRGMTDIQTAARFYIVIQESFGAECRSFGVKSKDNNKKISDLVAISERLRRVVIKIRILRKSLRHMIGLERYSTWTHHTMTLKNIIQTDLTPTTI